MYGYESTSSWNRVSLTKILVPIFLAFIKKYFTSRWTLIALNTVNCHNEWFARSVDVPSYTQWPCCSRSRSLCGLWAGHKEKPPTKATKRPPSGVDQHWQHLLCKFCSSSFGIFAKLCGLAGGRVRLFWRTWITIGSLGSVPNPSGNQRKLTIRTFNWLSPSDIEISSVGLISM